MILFCCLGPCKMALAQPPDHRDVAVLYNQLRLSKSDTGKVNLLLNICRYYNRQALQKHAMLDSVLATGRKAIVLSEKLNYYRGVGLSYQVMAKTLSDSKDFKKSDDLIKRAIAIFLAHDLYNDAAEAYLNMEKFYLALGGKDYKVMIGYYEQAQSLFHKAHAFNREGATLNMLGDFYQLVNEKDRALDRLNRALKAYKKTGYPLLQATYDLLGYVNMQKSRYQEALKYGLWAEKTGLIQNDSTRLMCTIYERIGATYYAINKFDVATYYFYKGLAIAEKFKDTAAIRVVLQSIFTAMIAEQKYSKALALLKSTKQKYPPTENESVIVNYANFIVIYSKLNNNTKAKKYVDSLFSTNFLSREEASSVYALNALTEYYINSRQFSLAAKYTPLFKIRAIKYSMKRREFQAYLMSFKADSARGNFLPAIDNYKKYFFLRDSLYDLTKTGQLEELKIKYETGQKEQSIVALQKNSILQQETIQRSDHIRNLTISGSLILIVFISLLYKSYRLNKESSEAIGKKNQSLNQLVTEKEWLLKEIHHRVKNNLQIVTGLLQRQSAYIDNDEALAAIQNSENRMHAIALIHQKLYQSESLGLIIMPEYIEEMISYLKDSCGADKRVAFERHVGDISLDVAQAVPLGLILNEAITNAIKYAYQPDEAGVIYVTFVKNEDQYNQLTIADNGPGLSPDFDIDKVDSLGMNLLRGLTKQLGGSLEISSEHGCTINIIFKTEFFNKTLVN
jgi:two-component sensor histidine kinase